MKNKKIFIMLLFIVLISTINTVSFASGIDFAGVHGVSSTIGGGNIIAKMGGAIFNAVRVAGAAIAVVYITMLGIKYTTSSVDDRADIKKRLVPFVIGAAIFFGVSFFVEMIIDIAGWLEP